MGVDDTVEARKGRATPSRKEAEAERRRRLQESARGTGKGRKNDRAEERSRREDARERMKAGDERFLGRRDRGPARRYARDLVDSRRTVGEYFLFAALGVLVAGIVPVAAVQLASQVGLVAIVFGVVVDSVLLRRRVVRAVRARYPDDEGTKGVATYAIMRGLSTRRMRLPAPQVRPGDDVEASARR